MADIQALETTYKHAFNRLFDADGFFPLLNDFYSSPNRHYHNWDHIEFMLKTHHVIWNHTPFKGMVKNYWAIVLAILYHDVVYDVRSGDNEANSANIFVASSMYCFDQGDKSVELIRDLILGTEITYKASEFYSHKDAMISYLRDIDLMSALGRSYEEVVVISNHIRQEYNIYSNKEWVIGRTVFLQNLLKKPKLYDNPFDLAVVKEWEDRTKMNIQKLLDDLQEVRS